MSSRVPRRDTTGMTMGTAKKMQMVAEMFSRMEKTVVAFKCVVFLLVGYQIQYTSLDRQKQVALPQILRQDHLHSLIGRFVYGYLVGFEPAIPRPPQSKPIRGW